MKNILVTGGAGYIGTHTIVKLQQKGYHVVALDNLSNSSCSSLDRITDISNVEVKRTIGDIRDRCFLESVFNENNFDAVIHFAGLKSVSESILNPLCYYENNVAGSLQLLRVMKNHNVKNLVFSSSATVYGDPQSLPLTESMATGQPTNPYGCSKLIVENILQEIYCSDASWNIVCLRYFNPVGAHKSGLIGERPNGTPSNLMPFMSQTAIGLRDELLIYGNDYPTPDGTGIRDYIHVEDLAYGHVQALKKISRDSGIYTVNLGTGVGYSVLEMVDAFSHASGKHLPTKVVGRREGDVAICYSDVSYAKSCLDWEAKLGINDMCEDSWRWEKYSRNVL